MPTVNNIGSAPAQKERLHHFDMIKGIAIFLVVMGHVITFCIRDLDRATIFKLIREVHMPLFFFISGWFSLKVKDNGDWMVPKLLMRARQLLVPMIVMSTIWLFYFPHSGLRTPFVCTFENMWFSAGKFGYWFTYSLFWVIALYAAVRPLFSRMKNLASSLAMLVVVWAVMLTVQSFVPMRWSELLTLNPTVSYFPVFMLGVLAHRYEDTFERLTKSSTAITISLVAGGFLFYFISWDWEFEAITTAFPPATHVARTLLHPGLIIVTFAIFKPWSEQSFSRARQRPGRMAAMWDYLGRESLAIYLIHYFFLFPLTPLQAPLNAMNVGFIPMMTVAIFWAAIIIAVVIGVNKIIKLSRPLAWLLTGKIK
jgi:fucose 4-O-acetylase-like acetyltransferase